MGADELIDCSYDHFEFAKVDVVVSGARDGEELVFSGVLGDQLF